MGLLSATGIAMILALGPLGSGVKITIGVETQVGVASGLPDPWMLPAALEGVGAVALVFLLGRRPTGRLRAWCVVLMFVSLVAGMAAQGAHAVWYDEVSRHLTLPWNVKLLISFVPPISAMATLHLMVKMVEDVISNVGRLLATREEESKTVETMVLDVLRGNPLANWKVVRDSTGLSESNAKRALTMARKQLASATHQNGNGR
jgi:hypothetical protein